MTSIHFTRDRQDRETLIKEIGSGKVVKRVVVDRGHRNGPEIHEITDNAIVNIYNQRTGKLITKLIARPNQIKRYYEEGKAPKEILNKAYEHMKKGYNEK
jgi:hypothetical protein